MLKILDDLLLPTPIMKLDVISKKLGNSLYAKLSMMNPTGSIKDLSVAEMISAKIEENGNDKNLELVLASSGNAGISLAYYCNLLGLKCHIFMPSSVSKSKIKLLNYFGAKCYIVDENFEATEEGGWIYESKKLQEKSNNSLVLIDQFSDKNNAKVHYERTGKEIFQSLKSEYVTLDKLFLGCGSGGTLMGVAKYFKENSPNTKIIVVDPLGGIFYDEFYGLSSSYESHKVEALSDSFIPDNVFDFKYIDQCIQYHDKDFEKYSKEIFDTSGIFSGKTSGFFLGAIYDYVKKNNLRGENLGMIITDNGYRNI